MYLARTALAAVVVTMPAGLAFADPAGSATTQHGYHLQGRDAFGSLSCLLSGSQTTSESADGTGTGPKYDACDVFIVQASMSTSGYALGFDLSVRDYIGAGVTGGTHGVGTNGYDLFSDSSVSISTEGVFTVSLPIFAEGTLEYSGLTFSGNGAYVDRMYDVEVYAPGGGLLAARRAHQTGGVNGNLVITESFGWTRRALFPGVYTVRIIGNGTRSGLGQNIQVTFSGSAGIDDIVPITGAYCVDVPGACANVDDNDDFNLADLLAWLASPIDVDGDGFIDPDPYGADALWLAQLLEATGQLGDDCNMNFFPDAYDIAVGASLGGSADMDLDGIPDECAPCPADLNADGVLNFDDIDAFITAFLSGDLLADIDNNGVLNFDDIDAFVASFLAGCP